MTRVRISLCSRSFTALVASTAIALALGSSSSHATTILSAPASAAAGSSFSISLGDQFDIFGQSEILGGADIDILFDPNVLSFTSATVGDVYTGYSLLPNLVGPGTEYISICCGGIGAGNSLFTVNFNVLGSANPGPTNVSFINDPLSGVVDPDGDGDTGLDTDANSDPIPDGALSFLEYPINAPNTGDPSVAATVSITAPTVTSVPEPASGTLFLIGVAAILAFRQRLFLRRRALPASNERLDYGPARADKVRES